LLLCEFLSLFIVLLTFHLIKKKLSSHKGKHFSCLSEKNEVNVDLCWVKHWESCCLLHTILKPAEPCHRIVGGCGECVLPQSERLQDQSPGNCTLFCKFLQRILQIFYWTNTSVILSHYSMSGLCCYFMISFFFLL
jgi:hypothetical protein